LMLRKMEPVQGDRTVQDPRLPPRDGRRRSQGQSGFPRG
jgi:hypothetical protein